MSYQKTWQDPAPGTVLAVPAGEPLELLFTCHNDAEKVVTFTAQVDGLGPWAPEKTPTLPVVPFEAGLIRVLVASSEAASPGDYPFTVSLFLNGDPLDANGTISLVMRLQPSVKPEPAWGPPPVEIAPVVKEKPVTPVVEPPKPPEKPKVVAKPKPVEKPKVEEKLKKPKVTAPKEELVAPVIPVEEPISIAEEPVVAVTPTTIPEETPSEIEIIPEPPIEEPATIVESVVAVPPIPEVVPEPVVEIPEPVIEEPIVEAPVVVPEPIAIPDPTPPVVVKPIEIPKPVQSGPKLIDLGPPPEARLQPEPEPEPEPEPIPIPIPTPVEPPKPVFTPPAPKVVDYGVKEEEPEEVVDVAAAYPSDHHFANPKEGTVLYARPGETILVRFSVSNDQAGVRTYVLQEDRSLPNDWIQLVRDQVNITPNGTGDVAFLLKPPIHAEPASYPFSVSWGVLGKPLSTCYLTLTVQAAPAVTVEAKKSMVSVGPMSKRVPFELQVESAGNSDTAYRLTVIDDSPAPDGTPQEPAPIYETPTWQYLFDKEVETLVSPTAGRTPPAIPHRLILQRKGTWWFGWREKHTVKVATVPVTDKRNNEKPGNIITITGSRWRIFPLPMFIMIPLLFIALVMLGSGGDNLRVTNGIQGDDGAFYVVGTEPNASELPVHLKWNSPIYAMLKLNRDDQGKASAISIQRESANDKASIQDYGQSQKISYELGSKFFGSGIKTDVRLVPMKTDGMLQIFDGTEALTTIPGKEGIGDEKVQLFTQEVTISIKRDQIKTLTFRNLTGTGKINGQTIVAWTVRQPQGFKVNDFLIKQGSSQLINPNSTVFAKVSVDKDNLPPDGEAIWELLTTDAKNQLLRIKLKVVE